MQEQVLLLRMQSNVLLTERYGQQIKGVLECYDRIVLLGSYQAIAWPGAMEGNLSARGIKLIDYVKEHANAMRLEMGAHIREQARRAGVAIRQVSPGQRKEEVVENILATRGRHEGIVCVLGAMENCRTFKLGRNPQSGFLGLRWAPGRCQHFYIYFIDAELGLCYLRIPTWAPFRLQFYCNGHDWLERRMKKAGLRFRKVDNCFTHISDFAQAQALAREFDPQRLHRILQKVAARWVALHRDFGPSLRFSIHQAEWATDIVFKGERTLPGLYAEIIRTAACEIGAADIYHFLGRRQTVRSKKAASSRLQTLVQGTRLKHSLGATSLKMYDKAGRVLRIECTTSDVKSFTHYRKVEPRRSSGASARKFAEKAGRAVPGRAARALRLQYAPMRKTLYSLPALSEAMSAVNQRYVAFISQWPERTKQRHDLRRITQSVRDKKDHRHRGVNFFGEADLQFMQAVLRGENQIRGLRNRSLQKHLPGWKPAQIGRHLRRFRAHGLLKAVAGTHKYYLTKSGGASLIAARQLTERLILPALAA